MNQPSLDSVGARDFALGPGSLTRSLSNTGMVNNPPHSGVLLACNSKSILFSSLYDGYGSFAVGADEQTSHRQLEEEAFLRKTDAFSSFITHECF